MCLMFNPCFLVLHVPNVCNIYQNFPGMWWRIFTNLAISASEKCSHIVYLLNAQIVIMSTMLNVSMQTEIMLYPVLCGTVCIVCKLYFHLTTLKTTRNVFQWSWNVSLIILFNFMKWTPKCSFPLQLMKAPKPIQWNGSRYSILLKHTLCSKHTMRLFYRRHILEKYHWKKSVSE